MTAADPNTRPPAGHAYSATPRADGRRDRGLLSPRLQARLERELNDAMAAGLTAAGAMPAEGTAALAAWIAEFFRLYPDRPIADTSGGSGFNDALWLFVAARALAPEAIVESGTHRGFSAWVLHRACPQAPIRSFDVDTSRVAWSDPQLSVTQGDWADHVAPDPANARALAFFDDHINHGLRVAQAHARGFRWLLLDDNFRATQVHATGGPPLPSLAMLFDPELAEGEEIAWTRNGKDYRWTYTRAAEHGARDLIAGYHPLPELAGITRFASGSGLSLVRLKREEAS
jgi:hypothetical protein